MVVVNGSTIFTPTQQFLFTFLQHLTNSRKLVRIEIPTRIKILCALEIPSKTLALSAFHNSRTLALKVFKSAYRRENYERHSACSIRSLFAETLDW
jgi:hypothetical protein